MESRSESQGDRFKLRRLARIPHRVAFELKCFYQTLKERVVWLLSDDAAMQRNNCDEELRSLGDFTSLHRDIGYHLTASIDIGENGSFDYVGAQVAGDSVYFIPNGANSIARVKEDGTTSKLCFSKKEDRGPFRWTGGALWRNSLVCFPRSSNNLLLLDLQTLEPSLIPLGLDYDREHHYGGVLVGDTIYQPPRGEDCILCTDLNKMTTTRIPLSVKSVSWKANYCGSCLHPNGLIYFLPQNGRVIELDPPSGRWRFIGPPLDARTYGAALAPDGCLYGFSGYANGIIRVDPEQSKAEMLRCDIGCPGAYGTRLGVNGKLYSVPGDGDSVLEFDPLTLSVREVCRLGESGQKAKCAGSATMRDGSFAFAPALGNEAYFLSPDMSVSVPVDLLDLFSDSY